MNEPWTCSQHVERGGVGWPKRSGGGRAPGMGAGRPGGLLGGKESGRAAGHREHAILPLELIDRVLNLDVERHPGRREEAVVRACSMGKEQVEGSTAVACGAQRGEVALCGRRLCRGSQRGRHAQNGGGGRRIRRRARARAKAGARARAGVRARAMSTPTPARRIHRSAA